MTDKEQLYLESLLIKIDHVEHYLCQKNLLQIIEAYQEVQQEKIILLFKMTHKIYAKIFAHFIKEPANVQIKDDHLFYSFSSNLISGYPSLLNHFFSGTPDEILEELDYFFQPQHITHFAIKEFNLLRGKQLSEKHFRLLVNQIKSTENPIQYIENIQKIIHSAQDSNLLFQREFNRFFGVGKPTLPVIMEGTPQEETFDEETLEENKPIQTIKSQLSAANREKAFKPTIKPFLPAYHGVKKALGYTPKMFRFLQSNHHQVAPAPQSSENSSVWEDTPQRLK